MSAAPVACALRPAPRLRGRSRFGAAKARRGVATRQAKSAGITFFAGIFCGWLRAALLLRVPTLLCLRLATRVPRAGRQARSRLERAEDAAAARSRCSASREPLPLEGGGRCAMSWAARRKCHTEFGSRPNSSLAHRVGVMHGARCKPPPSETPKDLAGPRARCCSSTGPSKSKALLLPPSRGKKKRGARPRRPRHQAC